MTDFKNQLSCQNWVIAVSLWMFFFLPDSVSTNSKCHSELTFLKLSIYGVV
jgi:hypothetical protein